MMFQRMDNRVEEQINELDEQANNTAPIRQHDNNNTEPPEQELSSPTSNCSLSAQSIQHVRKILKNRNNLLQQCFFFVFLRFSHFDCYLLSLLRYAIER